MWGLCWRCQPCTAQVTTGKWWVAPLPGWDANRTLQRCPVWPGVRTLTWGSRGSPNRKSHLTVTILPIFLTRIDWKFITVLCCHKICLSSASDLRISLYLPIASLLRHVSPQAGDNQWATSWGHCMSRKALNTWKGCLWQDRALWPLHTTLGPAVAALSQETQSNRGCGAGWCPASLLNGHLHIHPGRRMYSLKRQPTASLSTKYDSGISGGYRRWFTTRSHQSYTCRPRSQLKDKHCQARRPWAPSRHTAVPLFNFRDLNIWFLNNEFYWENL